MEALKSLIAKQKSGLQEKQLITNEQKFFRRGDLVAKETEDYIRRHRLSSEGADIGTNETQQEVPLSPEEKNSKILPRDEVIRRLRERAEPVRLFGESDYEAWQRLKRLEILMPEVNKGMRNDFKEAMDRVDRAYLNEIAASSSTDDKRSANDVSMVDSGVDMAEIEHAKDDMHLGNDDFDMDMIIKYCQYVMQLWGRQLNEREDTEKRSMKGKLDSATHSQTVSYLRPLFRKLKKRTITPDIKDSLTKIVKNLIDRDYIKAHDDYVELAIGNAPWPIGVTMVGIHSRTGREKIFDKNVAHVLNDETQRKYLQGLKRIMTKAQELFPTDPSRSVNFAGNH